MLSATVPENKWVSCNTIPNDFLKSDLFIFWIFIPSYLILPFCMSYNLFIRLVIVVFPAPVAPTKAIFSPGFAYRFISGKWWHKDLKKGET